MSQTKAQLIDAVDGSIVTADLADDAVNADKLASNSVVSASIVDGSIVNADINASAAIAGSKISPDFGSQNITTTGDVNCKDITLTDTVPTINLIDTNNDSDFLIQNANGNFLVYDSTNSASRLTIAADGTLDVNGNLDANQGLDVTGAITSTGDITITNTNPKVQLVDSNSDSDFQVQNDNGNFNVRDTTNSSNRLRIDANGDQTFSSAAGNASFTFSKSNAPVGEQSVTVKFDRNGTVIGGVGGPTQITGASGNDIGIAATNGGNLRFGTGSGGVATNRVSIDNTGDLYIADGDLVISTAGHGIDFSAQTPSSAVGASTSSEVLDHYEEGTWTPTTNGGTLTVATAHYVKVGSLVMAQAYVTFPSMSGGSEVLLQGYPFATNTGSDFHSAAVNSDANLNTQLCGQFVSTTMKFATENNSKANFNQLSGKFVVVSVVYTVH